MRVMLDGMLVAALTFTGPVMAAERARPPLRSVQLIAMGATAPSPGSETPPVPAAERAQPPAKSRQAPDFRVHDLSRRWVAFQMASDFGTDGLVAETAMAAPAGVPDLSALAGIPPVAVPLWMRSVPTPVLASAAYRFVPACSAPSYRPAGFLTPDAETRRAGFYGMMSSIACQYGIPVGLFDAMIIQESRYRPDIFSPKSAFGLTQLMPGTAVSLGVNRYDIEGNLRGGAQYLRQQLDRFGQYHLALAAYNAGPGRVRNGLVPPFAETQAYVRSVLSNWSRMSGLDRRVELVSQSQVPVASRPRVAGRLPSVSTF